MLTINILAYKHILHSVQFVQYEFQTEQQSKIHELVCLVP
jgi:hypothetical protein